MIRSPWSDPAHADLCSCPVCIAADLALLCRTTDPLARIAASLNLSESSIA